MDNIIFPAISGEQVSTTPSKIPVLNASDLPITINKGESLLLELILQEDLTSMVLNPQQKIKMAVISANGKIPFETTLKTPLRLDNINADSLMFEAKLQGDNNLILKAITPQNATRIAADLQSFFAENNEAPVLAKSPLSDKLLPTATLPLSADKNTVALSGTRIDNALGNLSAVELSPLKIRPLVQDLMQELKISPQVQQQIINKLPPLELMLSIKDIAQIYQPQNLLIDNFKSTLNLLHNDSSNPQIINQVVTKLVSQIQDIEGLTLSAQISSRQVQPLATLIDTPLGAIWSEPPLKLSPQTPLELEVSQSHLSEPLPDNTEKLLLRIANLLDKIVTSDTAFDISHISKFVQTKSTLADSFLQILNSFSGLTDSSKSVISGNLLHKLVMNKSNILSVLHNYSRASQTQNYQSLLGADLISELHADNSQNSSLLQAVDKFLASSVRETPQWRIIEIPFFDGNQITPFKLSLKKDKNRDKSQKTSTSTEGMRFMVESEFSYLGAFQFDGFTIAPQHRFDLIIRTSKTQNRNFCEQIINLFKKSIYDCGYAGTIKINQCSAFIKTETIEDTKKEGIYV